MNIIINYDFFDAVKDTNEGFTPFKVVRNCKVSWLKYNLPLLTLAEYLTFHEDFMKHMPEALLIQLGILFGANMAGYLTCGDVYKETSDGRLKSLVPQFKNMGIDTSLDLIKQSECDNRIYNFKLNNKKFPQLIEYKYVLVPSYNYQGDIIDNSVVQEHVIGSRDYIISHGSFKKVLKPVMGLR